MFDAVALSLNVAFAGPDFRSHVARKGMVPDYPSARPHPDGIMVLRVRHARQNRRLS